MGFDFDRLGFAFDRLGRSSFRHAQLQYPVLQRGLPFRRLYCGRRNENVGAPTYFRYGTIQITPPYPPVFA